MGAPAWSSRAATDRRPGGTGTQEYRGLALRDTGMEQLGSHGEAAWRHRNGV